MLRPSSATMFHTFQSSVAHQLAAHQDLVGDGLRPNRSSGSRRITTSNACVECRRRKIRCDGSQPCGQCQWYQHPEACTYTKPAQRVVPSRKLVENLNTSIDKYRKVLSKLFPSRDVDSLVSLPREELIDLILSPGEHAAGSPGSITSQLHGETPRSETADSLGVLEVHPSHDPQWDEAGQHPRHGTSDASHGLSSTADRQSSYVGISSITAALKVIMQVAPAMRPFITQNDPIAALPSQSGSLEPGAAEAAIDEDEDDDEDSKTLPPVAEGHKLIAAYFSKVHTFFPMIDEQSFWTTYQNNDRHDPAWLALLNMVLAVGSLAAGTSKDTSHTVYFKRARHHISLRTFGSGSSEMLQATAIMSGYYMHHLNRPNEANSLMGATLRMATQLGLHREYSDNSAAAGQPSKIPAATVAESRRRTWWSLYCLDTWASATVGRPSLGRSGEGVTIGLPRANIEDTGVKTNDEEMDFETAKILPLIHASEFCQIATDIQDRLAGTPLLKFDDLHQLDGKLVRWNDSLPSMMTSEDPTSCPQIMRTPRAVMKWRYQNMRIILHRPYLLSAALRGVPYGQLTSEEKLAIGKCRIIAARTIDDIAKECPEDTIAAWNGVSMAFQACMIPLVSLFCCSGHQQDFGDTTDAVSPGNPNTTGLTKEAKEWRRQVERCLNYLRRMERWSEAATKSVTFIVKLLEAGDKQQQFHRQQQQQHYAAMHAQLHAASQTSAQMPGGGYKTQQLHQQQLPQQQHQHQQYAQLPHQQQHHPQPLNLQCPTPAVSQGSASVSGLDNPGGMSVFTQWPDPNDPLCAPPLSAPLDNVWDDMAWDNLQGFPDSTYGSVGNAELGITAMVDQYGWVQPGQDNSRLWSHVS